MSMPLLAALTPARSSASSASSSGSTSDLGAGFGAALATATGNAALLGDATASSETGEHAAPDNSESQTDIANPAWGTATARSGAFWGSASATLPLLSEGNVGAAQQASIPDAASLAASATSGDAAEPVSAPRAPVSQSTVAFAPTGASLNGTRAEGERAAASAIPSTTGASAAATTPAAVATIAAARPSTELRTNGATASTAAATDNSARLSTAAAVAPSAVPTAPASAAPSATQTSATATATAAAAAPNGAPGEPRASGSAPLASPIAAVPSASAVAPAESSHAQREAVHSNSAPSLVSPAAALAPTAPTVSTLSSTASVAQPVPVAPTVPLATQLARPIFSLAAAGDGTHQMTITISPERLGPVTVHAIVAGDQLRVELFAPTELARDAVRGILGDLRRDLATTGLHASLGLSADDAPSKHGGNGQQGAQHQTGQSQSGSGAASQNSFGQQNAQHNDAQRNAQTSAIDAADIRGLGALQADERTSDADLLEAAAAASANNHIDLIA